MGKTYKEPMKTRRYRMHPEKRRCSVEGCDDYHYAKGYCQKHYMQIREHGRLTPEREKNRFSECSVPGCNDSHHSKGYCQMHYQQMYHRGSLILDENGYAI